MHKDVCCHMYTKVRPKSCQIMLSTRTENTYYVKTSNVYEAVVQYYIRDGLKVMKIVHTEEMWHRPT